MTFEASPLGVLIASAGAAATSAGAGIGPGRSLLASGAAGLAVLAGVFLGVKALASLVAAGLASAVASAPDWQASNEIEITRTDKIDTFFMGVVYSLFCWGRKGLSGASKGLRKA